MKKAKKKDNPGENIGNVLLCCAVLAVITIGFAIGIRKGGFFRAVATRRSKILLIM